MPDVFAHPASASKTTPAAQQHNKRFIFVSFQVSYKANKKIRNRRKAKRKVRPKKNEARRRFAGMQPHSRQNAAVRSPRAEASVVFYLKKNIYSSQNSGEIKNFFYICLQYDKNQNHLKYGKN